MRDILYLVLAILISIIFSTADPKCGETIEQSGMIDFGMNTTCQADTELGVPTWLAIVMEYFQ